MGIEDIDYIICHQANSRIIDYSAKKLGISIDRFFMNLDNYGNTSSGSITSTLNKMNEKTHNHISKYMFVLK